jgi:polyisoprenoid-binding protein YceI
MRRPSMLALMPLLALVQAHPALAAPDRFDIESHHTYPSLEMPHMGLSIWRGKFNKTTGKVTLDRAAKTGTAEITVDAGSIDFGHDQMNQFSLGADFLNVAKYPTMTYKGKLVFQGDTPASVDGMLTMIGVTRPVRLVVNSFKCIEHPYYKKEACGADLEGDLNRADFGMTKFVEYDTGKIHLRIQVEAIRAD